MKVMEAKQTLQRLINQCLLDLDDLDRICTDINCVCSNLNPNCPLQEFTE